MHLLSRIQDLKARMRYGSGYASLPRLSRLFLREEGYESDFLASEQTDDLQWVYYYVPRSETMGSCFSKLGADESVISINVWGVFEQSSFIMDYHDDPDLAEVVAQLLAYIEVHELTHWALDHEENMAHAFDQAHSTRWHASLVDALEGDLVNCIFRSEYQVPEHRIEAMIRAGKLTDTN